MNITKGQTVRLNKSNILVKIAKPNNTNISVLTYDAKGRLIDTLPFNGDQLDIALDENKRIHSWLFVISSKHSIGIQDAQITIRSKRDNIRYPVVQYITSENTLVLCEVYRFNDHWVCKAIGRTYNMGFLSVDPQLNDIAV